MLGTEHTGLLGERTLPCRDLISVPTRALPSISDFHRYRNALHPISACNSRCAWVAAVMAAVRRPDARVDAEEHLAQAEGKYRGLLEAAPDAMVVVNQAGEIVLLNVQAEKQFGYPRDELLGQKVSNIIPEGFAERLVADDLRSAEEALAQQIGTGIELNARRKDGSECACTWPPTAWRPWRSSIEKGCTPARRVRT